MAHFAKLGIGNKVERVEVVSNDIATTEQAGVDFLKELYNDPNGIWKQTSYNTYGGVHNLGGTPFRKNYASIGFKYDTARDAFIPPQRFPSWTLNETSCLWEAPVAFPTDGQDYDWNETTRTWDLAEE